MTQLVQLSQRDADETVLDLLDESQLARLVDDIVLLNRRGARLVTRCDRL